MPISQPELVASGSPLATSPRQLFGQEEEMESIQNLACTLKADVMFSEALSGTEMEPVVPSKLIAEPM